MGRVNKIIQFPDVKSAFLFSGGFLSSFFFLDLLLSVGGQVQGTGSSLIVNKLKRVYDVMKQNPVWSIMGGGILIAFVYAVRKLIPLIIGIIFGLTLRMLIINLGYSEPSFGGYVSVFL